MHIMLIWMNSFEYNFLKNSVPISEISCISVQCTIYDDESILKKNICINCIKLNMKNNTYVYELLYIADISSKMFILGQNIFHSIYFPNAFLLSLYGAF